MSTRDVWDGRPVTFAEFTIREGKAVNEAFAQGGEERSEEHTSELQSLV